MRRVPWIPRVRSEELLLALDADSASQARERLDDLARRGDRLSAQCREDLERVRDRLALEVVVGDHVRLLVDVRDRLGLASEGSDFRIVVQIVVPFVALRAA